MAPGTRYTARVALIVALGGFLMGFDASVISGVVGFIEPEFELTKIQLGWSVASLTLTSTIAMMLAGPISDRPVLSYVRPIYPEWAKRDAVEGSVTLYFVVGPDGSLGTNRPSGRKGGPRSRSRAGRYGWGG